MVSEYDLRPSKASPVPKVVVDLEEVLTFTHHGGETTLLPTTFKFTAVFVYNNMKIETTKTASSAKEAANVEASKKVDEKCICQICTCG